MSVITQQIQSLLTPPDVSTSNTRALQFLNATFPTFDALDEPGVLDKHVETSISTSSNLQTKLDASNTALLKTIANVLSKETTSLRSAKELSLTRHSLADQLETLTEDLVPTAKGKQRTLLEELEGLHIKLSELKSARTYVAVIEKALGLSEDAVAQVRSASGAPVTESNLSTYMQLQSFVTSVEEASSSASSPDPLKLVSFLKELRIRTWKDISGALSENLLNIAETLRWPAPIAPAAYALATPEERTAFESSFINLLRLQAAGEKLNLNDEPYSPDEIKSSLRKQGLYPLQALLEPIALRFRYHFDGKRQTNRLDKPEWYFTHVLNLMHEHRPFMTEVVQKLLKKGGYGDINAHDEFCRLLFMLPTKKLKRTVPLLLDTPAALAHTVYQTLIFDGSVRDGGFEMQRTWEGRERSKLIQEEEQQKARSKRQKAEDAKLVSTLVEWEGLSDVILGRKEWFDAWLAGEQRFADKQYNDMISSPDAWQISDDANDGLDGASSADLGTKVTNSARRFRALLERVTERYQPLSHLLHKSHFLFDIQLPLLEAYLARITSSLDAYERLSSSFVRAVPGALAGQVGHGIDQKRLTSGVEGLARVIKALLSARWVKVAMEAWGEDLFFLELWQGIQENPVLRARAAANALLPAPRVATTLDDQADSTLFDVLIKQYNAVVDRAEEMIVRQICAEVETDLKPYFASQYEKAGESDEATSTNALSLPATLVAPVTLLSSELAYLAQSLPTVNVTSIYRQVATSLSSHIVQRSVTHRGRTQFTATEGLAFKEESGLWIETCRMALSSAGSDPALIRRVDLPWQALTDVAAVVGVPEDRFHEVVRVAFEEDDKTFDDLKAEIGVRALRREDVQSLLRTRVDFRR